MRADEIVNILEKLSPLEYACEWDNPGMHIGHKYRIVDKILVAVDADDDVVEYAVKNGIDMIVTHHPLIFKGIKQINDDSFMGRRIMKLIENGINCYCMHTNFDTVGGMADVAAKKIDLHNCEVLEEVKNGEGIGRVGNLTAPLTVRELCNVVKNKFNLNCVALYGDENSVVSRVAICPGSGKDEIEPAVKLGAEVLITGDMTYHYGVDSVAEGLQIIDAGHYGIEHIFIDIVSDYLVKTLNGVTIVPMEYNNPQKYI